MFAPFFSRRSTVASASAAWVAICHAATSSSLSQSRTYFGDDGLIFESVASMV
jgi:hypothetical protein